MAWHEIVKENVLIGFKPKEKYNSAKSNVKSL
jgi:hypothetical protein